MFISPFSSFSYMLHSHMLCGLNHYTQQQTLSLFHTCIESILHKLSDNLNIFHCNLYRVLSCYHFLKYNITKTIVHHITIAPDTPIITIISGLKVSKYSRNTRNRNIRTKTLININFSIIFSPTIYKNNSHPVNFFYF